MEIQETKPEKSARAKHIEVIMLVFAVLGVLGLVTMGAKQILDTVTIVNVPVEGEWVASDKAWVVNFRPDKSFLIATGPAQNTPALAGRSEGSEPKPAERAWSDAWAAGEAKYSIDARGTVWVTLKNGRTYTATLTPSYPNQMDLIDSETGSVGLFMRSAPIKASVPLPNKASPPPQ
ncbi:hypothetical protein [Methylocapsa palsarum]|uniref:Uncharacterized protein n=1 Tax=Methylocapsa palsarum TaxID=1612308 RepID=A0A1I3Y5V1_9HYPH|nr:hypothetical protein [Methylocapsa palsarum]SFK27244.1 hypothetical protein SAMN05444581_10529 [Methylocapsa palsarum]